MQDIRVEDLVRSGGDRRWLETEDEHRYGRGRVPVGGEFRPFSMAMPESPLDLADTPDGAAPRRVQLAAPRSRERSGSRHAGF